LTDWTVKGGNSHIGSLTITGKKCPQAEKHYERQCGRPAAKQISLVKNSKYTKSKMNSPRKGTCTAISASIKRKQLERHKSAKEVGGGEGGRMWEGGVEEGWEVYEGGGRGVGDEVEGGEGE